MGLNVELLEQSFNLVAPKGEKLVERFYQRLFSKYPSVKPLFQNTSMAEQKKKLLAALVLVVQNLRHPDALNKALKELGGRHVGDGAQPAHYDAVRENMLAVLAEFAGPAWTDQVKQAWTDALPAISSIVLQGARRVGPSCVVRAAKGPPPRSRTRLPDKDGRTLRRIGEGG